MRPQVPLFFANAERVLGKVGTLLRAEQPAAHTVMLGLEETPDVDGTAIEPLRMMRACDETSPADALRESCVDECVQSLAVGGAQ